MFICIFECFFLVEVLYSDFIIDLLRKELKFSFFKLNNNNNFKISKMIEITCNDRLGKKVRIKCNPGMFLFFRFFPIEIKLKRKIMISN